MTDHDLRSCAHPLRTLDPADGDWSDLAALGTAIGDARIVCIGESMHGNREFYLLKDRLFRYLATELGFSAFVLESGFAEGWQVDAWVQGGPGNVGQLSRDAITYGLGDCEEMRDQLRWMRERNGRSQRKLRFYGADLGGSSVNPGSSVRACLARLPATADDARLAAAVELGPQHEALARWHRMPADRRAEIDAAVAAVAARAEASGDELARRFAASASIICGVFGQLARGEPFAEDENLRDAYMADTVRWILGREERIVVAAHNAHLQRNGMGPMPSLGAFLSDGSFPRAVVIGAVSGRGEVLEVEVKHYRFVSASTGTMRPAPDGIEPLLAASCHGSCLFDLGALSPESRPRTLPMLAQNLAQPTDIAAAFDWVVNIESVSVVEGGLDRLRASIESGNAIFAAEPPGTAESSIRPSPTSPWQVVQGQLDAYNAHDVDAFAAFYAEGVELYRPPAGEPFLRGREALVAHYRERFTNPKLHAGLVGRTSVGAFVFDHEHVTGVGEAAIDAVATFEVRDARIVRVWFFHASS